MIAVFNGKLAVLQQLLDLLSDGGDAAGGERGGGGGGTVAADVQRLLLIACSNGHVACVTFLLSRGAAFDGEMLLYAAVVGSASEAPAAEESMLAMLQMLLQLGATATPGIVDVAETRGLTSAAAVLRQAVQGANVMRMGGEGIGALVIFSHRFTRRVSECGIL